MTQPLLSILMPALESRPWMRMRDAIQGQINGTGDVEVIIDLDGELPSGAKRERLTQASTGQYVAMVDDDDVVSDSYIASLLVGCRSGADVVTFNLEFQNAATKSTTETWRFGLGPDARSAGRMAANHLCAWRRDIAKRVAWCREIGYGDDQLWYRPLHASGLAKTEWHCDETLYHYQFDSGATMNQRRPIVRFSRRMFGSGLRCFWFGDEIVIEVPASDAVADGNGEEVTVRDSDNRQFRVLLSELRHFHTAVLV